MTRRLLAGLFVLAMVCTAADAPRWQGMEFLIGKWKGEGSGATGEFSFQPELKGQILVRRNFSDSPQGRHEDLMVVYAGDVRKATYWDTEGHVIRYKVSVLGTGRVVFESEGEGPGYRLTYWIDGGALNGQFEVGGKVYLTWGARKVE